MTKETRELGKTRVRRIAGQIRAIERMIEDDRYCVDVLLQIAAVRAALDGLGKLLLQSHVNTCVADAVASGGTRARRQKLDELMDVLARFGGR